MKKTITRSTLPLINPLLLQYNPVQQNLEGINLKLMDDIDFEFLKKIANLRWDIKSHQLHVPSFDQIHPFWAENTQ